MTLFSQSSRPFEYRRVDVLGNPIPLGHEHLFMVDRSFCPLEVKAWGIQAREDEEALVAFYSEQSRALEARVQQEAADRRARRRAAYLQSRKVRQPGAVLLGVGAGLPALELRSNMDEIRRVRILKDAEWQLPRGATIRIAGRDCPRMGRSWMAYLRHKGESLRSWKQRVRGLVAAKTLGREIREDERRMDLDPFYQLMGLVNDQKKRDSRDSSFEVLSEIWLSKPSKAELARVAAQKKIATLKRLPVFGPKTNRAFEYIESRLARKKELALLHDEWQEAKFLRKEKMERALVHLGPHVVRPLRYCLEKLATEAIYEMRREMKNPKSVFHERKVQGEMEAEGKDPQGDTSSVIEKDSTVEMQHQTGDSIGSSLPETSSSSSYRELAACENPISAEQFCDRPFTLKQFLWTSALKQDDLIPELDIEIPRDILDNKIFKKSPNYLLFSRHMYWRGDIELELVCNANIRQYGQLQLSFYYGDSQDDTYDGLRNNIWTNSQRLHSLLTANFSNRVKLLIPFEYVFPNMAVNRAPVDGYRSLGRLQCRVVVPLTVVSTTASSCSCTLLVKFINNSFQGMVGQAIAEAEMLPLASIIAVKSLLDKNRDRPTMTSPGMPMIPVNASSWCAGTGQADYSNILRLDVNKVLPYAEGRVPSIDEMQIDYIKKIFGMFKISSWTAQDLYGHKLFSFNAVPLDDVLEYPSIEVNKSTVHAVPPLSVLTSLFSYWRGSIDLRVDIVGCTEITGRLLICYVPRVNKNFDLKIEDAFGCAHAIFDVRENRQIAFKIPFVASQMFWPRRSTVAPDLNTFDPPGAVFCFVYNPLIVNSTIPDNCKLILYLKGGEDFELAVPSSPSIGLAYDTTVYISKKVVNRVVPVEGYVPTYAGYWRSAYVGTIPKERLDTYIAMSERGPIPPNRSKFYIPILRYGEISDHITQFRLIGSWDKGGDKGKRFVAQLVTLFAYSEVKIISKYFKKLVWKNIKYLAISNPSNISDYHYGYPLKDENMAKIFSDTIVGSYKTFGDGDDVLRECWVIAFANAEPDAYSKIPANNPDIGLIVEVSEFWTPKDFYGFPWPSIEAQIDEREKLTAKPAQPQCNTQMSRAASLVFGEQFLDLKDYCRRYQLYASGKTEINNLPQTATFRNVLIKFPVMPQGLSLDLGNAADINEYWNRTRDGPIPIIASGYRFFTGGIRYRVCLNVVQSDASKDIDPIGKIFVQHRPNIINKSNRVIVTTLHDLNSDDLELPGYATYHQYDNLNNVLSIEIPFYIPTIRTYLQRLSTTSDLATRFGTLGEVAIGITTWNFSDFKISWDIYYSLADDARFSVFVGYPPVFDITNLPSIDPEPPKKAAERIPRALPEIVPLRLDPIVVSPPRVEPSRVEPVPLVDPRVEIDDDRSSTPTDSDSDFDFVGPVNDFGISAPRVRQQEWYRPDMHEEFKRQWTPELLEKANVSFDGRRCWYTTYKGIRFVACSDNQDDLQPWNRSTIRQRLNILAKFKVLTAQGQMFGFLKPKTVSSLEKVNDLVESVNTEEIKESISTFTKLSASLKENISQILPTFESIEIKFHKYVDLVINAATNLAHVILNFNLKSIGIAIVSFFSQLKVMSYSAIGSVATKMTNLFTWFAKNKDVDLLQQKTESLLPQGEMADPTEKTTEQDSIICSFVSTLVAGVAGFFNITTQMGKKSMKTVSEILFDGIGKFAFTANHLFTFIKNNLVAIKHIAEWVFSTHPSVKKLGFLTSKDTSIHKWAIDTVELTDPRRENEVFQNAKYATKVYVLGHQASLLQVKMLDLKLDHAQTTVLNNLIKKIHDLRDKLSKAHLAPPIRFEPFVYELTGASGIGKSELLKSLPYTIFQRMGFKHRGPLVYHRNLGNAYWNNLRNEPVCTIDEKFPVKTPEFLGAQLAELFQLKSSCVFNPPMAAVEDKHVKYNPMIVQYASNIAFVQLPEILVAEAVNRRRDILVRVSMDPMIRQKYKDKEEKLKYRHLSRQDRGKVDKFEYLVFEICKDPSDSASQYEQPMKYDAFVDRLCEDFSEFYKEEEKKFRREIARIQSVYPEDENEQSSLSEIYSYKWLDSFQEKCESVKKDDFEITEKIRALQEETIDREHPLKSYRLYSDKAMRMFMEMCGSKKEEIDKLDQRIKDKEDELKQLKSKKSEPLKTQGEMDQDKDIVLPTNGEKKDGCFCYKALAFIEYYGSVLKFNLEKQALVCKFNDDNADSFISLLQATGGKSKCQIMSELYPQFIDGNKIIIKFENRDCKNPKCPFLDENSVFKVLEQFYASRSEIRDFILRGQAMAELMPKCFVERFIKRNDAALKKIKKVEKHDELHEKVLKEVTPEKTQGWIERLKNRVYAAPWVKYLKTLSIIIAVFSAIAALIGMFSHITGRTECVPLLAKSTGALVGSTNVALGLDRMEKQKDKDEITLKLADGLLEVLGQAHVSGDYKASKFQSSSSKPAYKALTSMTYAKGEMGVCNEDQVKDLLRRNTFFLAVQKDDGTTVVGRCLGLAGHRALCVDHYWSAWNKVCEREHTDKLLYIAAIDRRASAICLNLKELQYERFEGDSSIGILTLPNRIPSFRDIRRLCAKQNSHSKLNGLGTIYEFSLSQMTVDLAAKEVSFTPMKNQLVEGGGLWDDFSVHDGYEYSGFSGQGRCGSILVAHGLQRPIIGIHVAGIAKSSWGFSEAVYDEMFNFSAVSSVKTPGEGQMSKFFVDAEVIGLGKVKSRFAHRERGTSRLIPSIVQRKQLLPILSEPAVLSNKDPRIKENPFSPMEEGCKHHGKPLIPFNQEDLELAVEDVKNLILAKCKPIRQPSRLTREQAIGGIPDFPGYEHMEFGTSEGFPFTGLRPIGASDKRWLFNFDQNNHYVSTHPVLDNVLDFKWMQRLNSEIPSTVFVDCLKDINISKEKVLQPGKTRVFSMSPVDFTIQQRQCTLDFVVAFMYNRRHLEHMIGCNPNSIDWTFLARDLLKIGNNIATGDYSKFGDTIPVEFIHAIFKIIREWYQFHGCDDAEMFQQLEIFPYEIGNSLHLMFDHIYQVVCGQPSGNSLTVIINSIANSLYLRLAWLEIMRRTPFNSLADFHKHVVMFSYGDDLIVSLSDAVKDQFNACSWHVFFGKHLLKFTNANKSDQLTPFGSLAEADFLKCGFRDHPTRHFPQVVLAPLAQESIEETPNWVWEESFGRSDDGSLTYEQMSIQVCTDSIRNAFGRGPKYYSEWREKLLNFWVKRGIPLTIDTWQQLDIKIFDLDMELQPYFKALRKFKIENL